MHARKAYVSDAEMYPIVRDWIDKWVVQKASHAINAFIYTLIKVLILQLWSAESWHRWDKVMLF